MRSEIWIRERIMTVKSKLITSITLILPYHFVCQMKLDLLSYEHDAANDSLSEEPDNSFVSSIKEQQNQLQQMVRTEIQYLE